MKAPYTQRQGEFLTFIHQYTSVNGRPPAEADMQRHFGVTPPTVHQMVLTLEKRKLIQRTPGMSRSIRLLIPSSLLPREDSDPAETVPPPEAIVGDWRITQMDQWDQTYVDEEVEGYIRFDRHGLGEFHFAYVQGEMDYELTQRDGRPAAEWSWEGNDQMDPATGRGWAVLQEDGTLTGRMYMHQRDCSGFSAVKRSSGTGEQTHRRRKSRR